MKTYAPIEHVRLRPGMYCPFPENNLSVFQIALRYFVDAHLAGCSQRLFVDYEGNHVRLRDFGSPIPFSEMHAEKCDSFKRWSNDVYGYSCCYNVTPTVLMGLCNNMELTSFCAGKMVTCRSADDGRCGKILPTQEPDGIEIRLTTEKDFDAAYVNALIHQFHALHPDLEICVNGKELLKSNGLIDLLYGKLCPMRILEPLFTYQSTTLDFSAALQVYPKISFGPFIYSFLNGYETYEGGEHNDVVKSVLERSKLPYDANNLCVIFHCKVSYNHLDMIYDSMAKSRASFASPAARDAFEQKITDLFKNEFSPQKELYPVGGE